MANRYLLPVYSALYDRGFKYSSFDQRMEMQKAIYLLQDMGVPVGDYGFRWYLHGPYSQTLQDDMHYENGKPFKELNFPHEHAHKVMELRNVIHSPEKGKYSITNWVECLASLRYLQENLLSFDVSEDEVIEELERRKKHLCDHTANKCAFRCIERLFA